MIKPTVRMLNNTTMPRGTLFRLSFGSALITTNKLKSNKPGELIEIDHMIIKLGDGRIVKHFQAICPITRYVVSRAYRDASSHRAQHFLSFLKDKLSFPILSIQVDGGSEFMGEFEQACRSNEFPLYVPPPRMPKMNTIITSITTIGPTTVYRGQLLWNTIGQWKPYESYIY